MADQVHEYILTEKDFGQTNDLAVRGSVLGFQLGVVTNRVAGTDLLKS